MSAERLFFLQITALLLCLNFGQIYEGRIFGYNRNEQALTVDEISVEEGNVRQLSRYNFYSNEIKSLKSEFNSIINSVENFKNFKLFS